MKASREKALREKNAQREKEKAQREKEKAQQEKEKAQQKKNEKGKKSSRNQKPPPSDLSQRQDKAPSNNPAPPTSSKRKASSSQASAIALERLASSTKRTRIVESPKTRSALKANEGATSDAPVTPTLVNPPPGVIGTLSDQRTQSQDVSELAVASHGTTTTAATIDASGASQDSTTTVEASATVNTVLATQPSSHSVNNPSTLSITTNHGLQKTLPPGTHAGQQRQPGLLTNQPLEDTDMGVSQATKHLGSVVKNAIGLPEGADQSKDFNMEVDNDSSDEDSSSSGSSSDSTGSETSKDTENQPNHNHITPRAANDNDDFIENEPNHNMIYNPRQLCLNFSADAPKKKFNDVVPEEINYSEYCVRLHDNEGHLNSKVKKFLAEKENSDRYVSIEFCF